VADALACRTLYPRFERAAALVRSGIAARRCMGCGSFDAFAEPVTIAAVKAVAATTVAVTFIKPRSMMSWAGD
jgi:hypothetical protein